VYLQIDLEAFISHLFQIMIYTTHEVQTSALRS
jgi:hypothetical protein